MESDEFVLHQMTHAIAGAIERREVWILAGSLAPGFIYRSEGGQTISNADAFLEAVRNIPGGIVFVRVERVTVDVANDAAFVTGEQHAQVVVDGQAIDDRRSFANFFIKVDGSWKLRAGADFPLPGAA